MPNHAYPGKRRKRGGQKRKINWGSELDAQAFVDPEAWETVQSVLAKETTRRVLANLLTGADRSFRSGSVIFGRAKLCDLMRRWDNSYSIKTAVRDLRDDGLLVTLDENSGHTGRQTEVLGFDIPADRGLIERLLNPKSPLGERVSVVTGSRFDPDEANRMRLLVVESADRTALCDDAMWLIKYLNEPSEHFEAIRDLAPELSQFSQRIHGDQRETIDHDRMVLRKLEVTPQPIYWPVLRTTRVFSNGFSLLSRPVRKELAKRMGWICFDLKAFQLAVVAKLWDCPSLYEFLAKGGSYWHQIQADLNLDDPTDSSIRKDVIKDATYATIFGAGENTVTGIFGGAGLTGHAPSFIGHPWIQEILSARSKRFESIKLSQSKCSVDAYGNKWSSKKNGLKSAACAEVQSYEIRILVPAIRKAVEKHGDEFLLTSFIHDGFAIYLSDAGQDDIAPSIQRDVDASLLEFCFPSCLERS